MCVSAVGLENIPETGNIWWSRALISRALIQAVVWVVVRAGEEVLYLMAIADQEVLLSGSGSGFLRQMRVFPEPVVLS